MQRTNSCSPNPSNTHLEVQAKRVGWARHLSLSHDFMGGCSKCLWPQSYQPCGITPFLAEKMPKTISTVITPVDMFFYHQMLNSSNPSSQKHHWCLGSRLVVYGEGTMDFLTGGTLGWGCSPRNSVRRKLWGGNDRKLTLKYAGEVCLNVSCEPVGWTNLAGFGDSKYIEWLLKRFQGNIAPVFWDITSPTGQKPEVRLSSATADTSKGKRKVCVSGSTTLTQMTD